MPKFSLGLGRVIGGPEISNTNGIVPFPHLDSPNVSETLWRAQQAFIK